MTNFNGFTEVLTADFCGCDEIWNINSSVYSTNEKKRKEKINIVPFFID